MKHVVAVIGTQLQIDFKASMTVWALFMATSCTLLADKSAIRQKVVGVQGCWDSVEYEKYFRELLETSWL